MFTRPTSMPPQSPLLQLPREIRDEIYAYYVYTEDGYHHSPITGKLHTADNQPIDLSLMYTCRLIASEFSGVALRHNRITFTTIPQDESRKAERFSHLLEEHKRALMQLVALAAPCVTPRILETLRVDRSGHVLLDGLVKLDAPASRAEIQNGIFDYSDDELESTHYQLLQDMLPLISAEPGFHRSIAEQERDQGGPKDSSRSTRVTESSLLELLELKPVLWSIPSEDELTTMSPLLPRTIEESRGIEASSEGHRLKLFFLATTAAIRFLTRLTDHSRSQVRHILILEDRISIGFPEQHAQGLVPFFKEKSNLTVERRVNI
ncbi:hypothetical protein BDV95DRAFT_595083 [Massariosphaeria phaeospora]|uniref:Uncharacterized protein n=1 Tax=Massariosphaeria phaeospora TaxID=100035 RepID=A0A7C8I5B2_9PLEO|nr:hypothetical protein BDV95DRAFT_595083 [Massariosphaeria phaeospora]